MEVRFAHLATTSHDVSGKTGILEPFSERMGDESRTESSCQFNALDKSNLGNAKTAGLEKDLGMKGTNKYNILLSVFFVPYVLAAPFLGILGKMYGPSRVLPCMMFSFGTLSLIHI